MYHFYLAGPIFCDEDHKGLDLIEKFLRNNNYSFFSPRRDSNIKFTQTQGDRDQIAQSIFDKNIQAINSSRFLLVNTIGVRHNNALYGDEGTFIEVGYAIAKNIPIITYNWFGYGLNLMVSQKSIYHIDNISYNDTKGLEIINDITASYMKIIYDNEDILDLEEMQTAIINKLRAQYFKSIKDIV